MYIVPLVCCHISFMFFRWAFLVALPFVKYKFVVGQCTYMFEIMSDLFQCICLSYTPLVVFICIYTHLINDMKLESSQFIYYPKQAELLFAWVEAQALKFRTSLFPHLVPPAIMVWILVWRYIFEPFVHILQHFVLQLSRSTKFCF